MKYYYLALPLFIISCNQINDVKEQPIKVVPSTIEPISDTNKAPTVVVTINKYDNQLSEYAALINKYIKATIKAKKGDVSALTECTSISLETKEVENRLLNAAQKLSKEQQEKLKLLYQKFENASTHTESTKK